MATSSREVPWLAAPARAHSKHQQCDGWHSQLTAGRTRKITIDILVPKTVPAFRAQRTLQPGPKIASTNTHLERIWVEERSQEPKQKYITTSFQLPMPTVKTGFGGREGAPTRRCRHRTGPRPKIETSRKRLVGTTQDKI